MQGGGRGLLAKAPHEQATGSRKPVSLLGMGTNVRRVWLSLRETASGTGQVPAAAGWEQPPWQGGVFHH